MKREFNYPIMNEIKRRWSPRAFSEEKIAEEEILSLLEAARYAPSCFNEQPWRFLVASKQDELKIMRSLLTKKNQRWASKAPVLILIIAHRYFAYNGRENHWSWFDSGTAWGYLSLEAERRGLIAHGMAGFRRKETREVLKISEDYDIIAVIAIGKMGARDNLDEDFKKEEFPNTRRPIGETALCLMHFLDEDRNEGKRQRE